VAKEPHENHQDNIDDQHYQCSNEQRDSHFVEHWPVRNVETLDLATHDDEPKDQR